MVKQEIDMQNLSRAAGYSLGCLEPFRRNRLEAMREYVGTHYSDNGAGDRVPIPLIELSTNIYLQRLIANTPKNTVGTDYDQLRESAYLLELSSNKLIKDITLEETLSIGTIASFFSIGIIKTGMNYLPVEFMGPHIESGMPFAKHVRLDNWVHDMGAECWEDCQFFGDRYTMTMDEAGEVFDDETYAKLSPERNQTSMDKAHDISERGSSTRTRFLDTVALWDVYLPKQNVVITCIANDDNSDPFGEIIWKREYMGPKRITGPYHILDFTQIEGNTMPLAPVALWRDLHDLANNLFRKLGRQAKREKSILAATKGNPKDLEKVIESDDGEAAAFDNPDKVGEKRFGGINPNTLAFLLQVKDLYSYLAGNLDMLGGLGAQSETLGQDQLLSASASQRIQRMQKNVVKWIDEIIRSLCWYLWYDPYINLPIVKRVPGIDGVGINVRFTPSQRRGDFMDYNLRIEPQSLQHQSSESKLLAIRTIFKEIIAPSLPIMAQQGVTVDFEALFRKIGNLGSVPELNEILQYSSPQIQQPVGDAPAKAGITHRTYERVNRPGATNQGKTQIMTQALLGANPQPSEAASLFRSTG